jgi:hypothetical protein
MNSHDPYARWFGRVVLLGVAVNLWLALPSLFYPNAVLSELGLPPVLESPLRPSLAAVLALLACALYLPAAFDPGRYRRAAYLTVCLRLFGALYFLVRASDYALLGTIDLALALGQGGLLAAYLWSESRGRLSEPGLRGEHVKVAA